MQNQVNQTPLQKTSNPNSGKLIFGILLVVIYIWLGSVALSKKPTYAQMLDPGYDSQGRFDYSRGTLRLYEWNKQSAWNGNHTLMLLLTAAGTFVYWKKYVSK